MVDVSMGLGALRVAGTVLKHFLDGPERRLRVQKLELEIRRLLEDQARQRTTPVVPPPDLSAVVEELRRLTSALPGVAVEESRRKGPVLVREGGTDGAAEAVARLAVLVEARRHELMAATETTAPAETTAPTSPTAPTAPTSPTSVDGPGEIESSEPTGEPSVSDAERRLGNLERRMRERREEGRSWR
ncbi:hypothetical protein [Pimelobacter simplex]|uniref:hypothetical protein n=1 Tax=Nocardioides simplex TaxID=2045 RepID=UPI003AB08314